MGLHWIKADGSSQTWHDEPAAPTKASAPSKQSWRRCDWSVIAIGLLAAACAYVGVFS